MKKVFVCSPLRGPDGQPSERNINLARKLMRAVFDAGHAPFVPHLLYPQVLSESPADLVRAFEANYLYLNICDELWIYATGLVECSKGMCFEIEHVIRRNTNIRASDSRLSEVDPIWMPPEFAKVKADFEHEQLTTTQSIAHCVKCQVYTGLNSQQLCKHCFAGGTPV